VKAPGLRSEDQTAKPCSERPCSAAQEHKGSEQQTSARKCWARDNSRSQENPGLTHLHRVNGVLKTSRARGRRGPRIPDWLTSFQTAQPSQKLMDSLGTVRRSEQTITNEGRFKLFDAAVSGRPQFLMPPPPGTSGPLAATGRSDPSQAQPQK